LHLSKAVALLLPIPFTFHMATELLRHLTLHAAQSEAAAADPSTPRTILKISTQIAASGLLQQLPAALQTAQQQLQRVKPQGWCGTACHFCQQVLRGAREMDVADPETDTVQDTLLQAYSELLAFWPGRWVHLAQQQ
jgi:hypothetical protein